MAERFDVLSAGGGSAVTHAVTRANRRGQVVQIQTRGSMSEQDMEESNGAHQIHVSAYCGDCEAVKKMLDVGKVNINCTERSGRQAIHYAAHGGHCSIISALIERKARVNVEDDSRSFPLFYGASSGRLDAMKLLLELRASVDQSAKGKIQCLHGASGKGSVDSVAFLLDHRAKPDVRDSCGVRPIDVACQDQYKGSAQHKTIMELLQDAVGARQCLSDAAPILKKKGGEQAALICFNKAKKHLDKWKLPRLKSEVSWEASNCELKLEQYGPCMMSCSIVLKSGYDPVEHDRIEKRLEVAKTGMRRLREKVIAEAEEADAKARVEAADCASLKGLMVGDLVEAHSLVGAAALNGKQGTVGDFKNGRFQVEFPEEGGKALKPDNLKLVKDSIEADECKAQACDGASDGSCDGGESDEVPDLEPKPTCVVCLDADALFVGLSCGHLSLCATCRRKAVHIEKGEQGSKRSLSAAQLDRANLMCPVCRELGGFVRFKGNRWRKGGNEEVYIPLEEESSERLAAGYHTTPGA